MVYRCVYYHGLIDTKHLNAGVDYEQLPRVSIIVILPYDPFGQKRMVYTIKNQCVEDPSVSYEDGARKIFLYTKGTEGNPSQSLRDMLKYMEDTRLENVTNEDIHRIHEFVEKAKHRKEVGINYMKMWEEKRLIQREALAEGRAEGRAESIGVVIETCQDLHETKEDTTVRLEKSFKISKEEALEYIKKYWK